MLRQKKKDCNDSKTGRHRMKKVCVGDSGTVSAGCKLQLAIYGIKRDAGVYSPSFSVLFVCVEEVDVNKFASAAGLRGCACARQITELELQ